MSDRKISAFSFQTNDSLVLEHGIEGDKSRAVQLLLDSLPQYGIDPQAIKSIEKALKCGGPEVFEKIVKRLCEPANK